MNAMMLLVLVTALVAIATPLAVVAITVFYRSAFYFRWSNRKVGFVKR
jgi:hypothetical protein